MLLVCIVSRLITSINFIEDAESLAISSNVAHAEFLYSFQNFASPLYCLLIKVVSYLTHNFSISFSIIGGVSTFTIIFYTLKLLKVPITSLEGGLTVCLIFFNPLVWIAGNRFSSDLTAVSISIGAYYYLMTESSDNKFLIGWFLAGLVGGVNILYFPFLILPVIYAAITKRQIVRYAPIFLAGVLIWLLPTFLTQTISQTLANISNNLFPSTVNNIYNLSRITDLIKHIWAGGLGGYWIGRSPFTLLLSIALMPCIFFGTMILLSFNYPRSKIFTTWGAFILFFIWIYFCKVSSNISVLILMPFFIVVIAYGLIYFLVNFNLLAVKVVVFLFLVFNVWLGIYFAIEHQQPNAAAQLRSYLIQSSNMPSQIIAEDDLCDYLNYQNSKKNCSGVIDVKNGLVIALSSPSQVQTATPKNVNFFTHNTYVNSKWSFLELREY